MIAPRWKPTQRSLKIVPIDWHITILLIPLFILILILIYFLCMRSTYTLENIARKHAHKSSPPMFDPNECKICQRQAFLKTTATCGHNYCGRCIFKVCDRSPGKAVCPACLLKVTTLFPVFQEICSFPKEEKRMKERIQEYNNLGDDTRGFWRCMLELPYVWGHIVKYFADPKFYAHILRSPEKVKILLILTAYIICPYDLLPQKVIGVLGLFDDAFAFFIGMTIVSQAALSFHRIKH